MKTLNESSHSTILFEYRNSGLRLKEFCKINGYEYRKVFGEVMKATKKKSPFTEISLAPEREVKESSRIDNKNSSQEMRVTLCTLSFATQGSIVDTFAALGELLKRSGQ